MISKLRIGKILHSSKKLTYFSSSILNFNFNTTTILRNYAEEYRHILIKLNLLTLRSEMIRMKKLRDKQAIKYKKKQIIDQLCQLQPQIIQQRVNQLKNKSTVQISTQKRLPSIVDNKQKQQISSSQLNSQKKPQLNQNKQLGEYLTKQKSHSNILKQSLKQLMSRNYSKLLASQVISSDRIMDALYHDFVQKNKKKTTTKHNFQNQKQTNLEKTYPQNYDLNSQQLSKNSSQQLLKQNLQKLKRKPFVNRLFKTNQQIMIEQKKRKYLYEYQKSQILNELTNTEQTTYKQFLKNMTQIKAEKLQSPAMKGFYMNFSVAKSKKIFNQRKDKILQIFCGFNYFKQLCTNPYLVQFIFALTFDKQLPVEYTILKIAEECQQSPQTFKSDLMAISNQHFLKFLRTSANYLLKVFKRADNISVKKQTIQPVYQKQDDEDYDADQDNQADQDKPQKKSPIQSQKFPKSRQFIDLQLMRFAFALFEGGIERVVKQISENRQIYLSSQEQYKNLSKAQQKQLKSIHQTLILCFDVYKTMQSLFVSVQINDFTDLDKLTQILIKYHNLRIYLRGGIGLLQSFMRKYDNQYEQKLQLGLSNIITQRQLQRQNFVLRLQARKLNFDIIDNITSMLKHDNIQITLQNKRQLILKILQRFCRIYVQNDMIDFLQDELIYTIVRFLQKQVYLDKKIKSLFQARVNFDNYDIQQYDINNNKQNKQIKGQINNQVNDKIQRQKQNNKQKQYQNSIQQYNSNNEFQWFQYEQPLQFSKYNNNSKQIQQQIRSKQNNIIEYNPYISLQRQNRLYYYMGRLSQLLCKQLLYYLITIIKYKHSRKQIIIQQINGFNLIQQWYSQPNVIRLQFLKQQILQKYKLINQQLFIKKYHSNNKNNININTNNNINKNNNNSSNINNNNKSNINNNNNKYQ